MLKEIDFRKIIENLHMRSEHLDDDGYEDYEDCDDDYDYYDYEYYEDEDDDDDEDYDESYYYCDEYHEYYDDCDIQAPVNDYSIPEFLMEGYEPTSVKHYGNTSGLSDVNLPKIININGVEYVQINQDKRRC